MEQSYLVRSILDETVIFVPKHIKWNSFISSDRTDLKLLKLGPPYNIKQIVYELDNYILFHIFKGEDFCTAATLKAVITINARIKIKIIKGFILFRLHMQPAYILDP